MDKILTDPELAGPDEAQLELLTLRKKTLKIDFMESENATLRTKIKDLTKTVTINKEIIGALVDSMSSQEYKSSFQIFQKEIKNQMELCQSYY